MFKIFKRKKYGVLKPKPQTPKPQTPEFVKKIRDIGGTDINIEKITKDK